MCIGEKIRKRRKELKMSQEELATKVGYTSKSSINKIENGVNDIPLSNVFNFAKALNTTVSYLMGIENEKNDVIYKNSIGEKIKQLRKNQNMTLEQLGDKVGVGKSTVRKWENGMISNMRQDKVVKLAEALNTTPTFLMGWKEGESNVVVSDVCINSIGEKIRKRREELGMSQEELAKKMGYSSRSSINKIENGRAVTQKIIYRLAQSLNISPSYLIGWETNDTEETNTILGLDEHINKTKFTDDEIRQIEDFAEYLISKRKGVHHE